MVNFFKLSILISLLGLSACFHHAALIEMPPPAPAAVAEENAEIVAPEPDAALAATPEPAPSAPTALIDAKSINGAWRLTMGEDVCQIFTTHTRLQQGYRASTRQCPAPLNQVHGWQVKESQLNLLNSANEIIVSLSQQQPPEGSEEAMPVSFIGILADGTNISLGR